MLLSGESTVGEWRTIRDLIKSFGVVSSLCMNEGKSILLHDHSEENVTNEICDLFGVASSILDEGFTYFGFKMKLKGYYNNDWAWLIQKFHKKIVGSTNG